MTTPSAVIIAKTLRQGATCNNSAAANGAISGRTALKVLVTENTDEATSPLYWSRTIARDTTRPEDTPTPCSRRATIRSQRLSAAMPVSDPTT